MTRNLLFLPGAGADPAFWKPLGALLPAEWTKTYVGWPGLGHQLPSPAVTSFSDLVAMAEASLGDSPCDLLAQSMGGAVALQVALRNPQRVRRLVLAATSGGIDVAALGAADWWPAYRLEYPDARLSILDGWPDLTGQLPALAHPALLLWGDDDPISPVSVGRRLASLLPNARLEIIGGGDHAFVAERPAATSGLIRQHLE
jgi:pimeloyl-ACP methyl ester carboxylesterase